MVHDIKYVACRKQSLMPVEFGYIDHLKNMGD